jgi:hypothetical protein
MGVIWATIVHKKTGTVNFMSRGSASPELDNAEEKSTKESNDHPHPGSTQELKKENK